MATITACTSSLVTRTAVVQKRMMAVPSSSVLDGLFKKIGELCNLYGTEAAVITFSNAGNTFAFGNPSVDSVLDRYLSMTSSSSRASASFSSLF